MKTLATMFLLMMAGAPQPVTLNTQAFNLFVDANGNEGSVLVTRETSATTGETTTTLGYSFCVQTTAASCLEGGGVIPNNAFAGQLTSNIRKTDVLTLVADTTISGFLNELCLAPNPFGGCNQGTSPATGGSISLTYTKKLGDVEVFTFGDFQTIDFKTIVNSLDTRSGFSGHAQGTVIGTNVSTDGASLGFDTLTGKVKPGAHSLLEKSLEPAILLRLQRLTGKSVPMRDTANTF